MERSGAAGNACQFLAQIHQNGYLGAKIDPDFALEFYDRGCELADIQSCLSGAELGVSFEIADSETALTFAKRGCDMETRDESMFACEFVARIYQYFDPKSNQGIELADSDYANILTYLEKACRRGYGGACLKAVELYFEGHDQDAKRAQDLSQIGCALKQVDSYGMACARFNEISKQIVSAPKTELINTREILDGYQAACLERFREGCQGAARTYLEEGAFQDIEAARFFAQRECDLYDCHTLLHIYQMYGRGADSLEITAYYLKWTVSYAFTNGIVEPFGKLGDEREFFADVVSELQRQYNLPVDGKFKQSTFSAIRNNHDILMDKPSNP